MNARSINNKRNDLNLLIEEENPGILLICETWLDKTVDFSLEDFKVYRKDRLERGGGGVLVGVRNEIACDEVNILSRYI